MHELVVPVLLSGFTSEAENQARAHQPCLALQHDTIGFATAWVWCHLLGTIELNDHSPTYRTITPQHYSPQSLTLMHISILPTCPANPGTKLQIAVNL